MNISNRTSKLLHRYNETKIEETILKESCNHIFTMFSNTIQFLKSKQASTLEFNEIYLDILTTCDNSYHKMIKINFVLSELADEWLQINKKYNIFTENNTVTNTSVEESTQIPETILESTNVKLDEKIIDDNLSFKVTNLSLDIVDNNLDLSEISEDQNIINTKNTSMNSGVSSQENLLSIIIEESPNNSELNNAIDNNEVDKSPQPLSEINDNEQVLHNILFKVKNNLASSNTSTITEKVKLPSTISSINCDNEVDKSPQPLNQINCNEQVLHNILFEVKNNLASNNTPTITEQGKLPPTISSLNFDEKVSHYILSGNQKICSYKSKKRTTFPVQQKAIKLGSPPFQSSKFALFPFPTTDVQTKQLKLSAEKEDKRKSLNLILEKIKKPEKLTSEENFEEQLLDEQQPDIIESQRTHKTISELIETCEAQKCVSAVKIGDQCIVTRVYSPSNFSIVVANKYNKYYDSFHEDLQSYAESADAIKFSNKEDLRYHRNNIVCCYTENEEYSWFRCEIIDWLDDNEEYVFVNAIDDGFREKKTIDNIRGLSSEFVDFPRMSHQCRLAYLYPPGSTASNRLDFWPNESINFFKRAIYTQDSYRLFTINEILYNNFDILAIELCNSNGISVNVALVSAALAIAISPFETVQNYIESCDEKESNLNNAEIDLTDCEPNHSQAISNIFGGYSGTDYSRFCRFTTVPGQYCFKGSRCKLEHDFLDPDGFTKDKAKICFKTLHEIELPPLNSFITIRPTAIVNDLQFYCQIISPKKTYNFFSDCLTFYKFHKKINEPNVSKKFKKMYTLPAPHQLVLFKSVIDHFWYRGRVLDISSKEYILVQSIDYGNYENIPFPNLRLMEEDYLVIPGQAIQCSISEATPLITLKFDYLCRNILDKKIMCTIRSNEIPLVVEFHKILS